MNNDPNYQLLAEQLAAEIVGLRAAMREAGAFALKAGEEISYASMAVDILGAALEVTPHSLVRELLAARELAEADYALSQTVDDGAGSNFRYRENYWAAQKKYAASKVPA